MILWQEHTRSHDLEKKKYIYSEAKLFYSNLSYTHASNSVYKTILFLRKEFSRSLASLLKLSARVPDKI